MAVRQHGWTCPQLAMLVFFLTSLMSSLPVVETEIPVERERRRPSRDRFDFPESNDVTVWDLGPVCESPRQ